MCGVVVGACTVQVRFGWNRLALGPLPKKAEKKAESARNARDLDVIQIQPSRGSEQSDLNDPLAGPERY